MRIKKDYSRFVPTLLDLRKLGLQKREIIADGYLNSAEYKEAAKIIAENSLTLENSVMQETLEIEETAPEIVENEPKEAKTEKPKPPRLTKIVTRNLDLEPGKVHRLIITAAQDDTPEFDYFFTSLERYATVLGARLITTGLTYQKGLFEDHAVDTASYSPRVEKYLVTERLQITKDILLISDANVLPTTANPLAGWQQANRGNHVIVPSTRIALESIQRMQSASPRFAVSTGCCTLPSYTPRAAGRKALWHHTFAALLVEIDTDGEVFFRHLIADADGSFQDLNIIVSGDDISGDGVVEAISWGDIHHEQLDPAIALASFGYDVEAKKIVTRRNLLDYLRPAYQFLHDTIDFRRRNHHDAHDPHSRARVAAKTNGSVEDEVREAANFVNVVSRDWCRTVVIESNHDAALPKWLKNPEGQFDAENAYYWHDLNAIWHRSIREGDDAFNPVHEALRLGGMGDHIDFVGSGESFVVLDIEHGLHGDIGVGGSRGSPNQFRRFGVRTTTGHTHSPSIMDGSYVSGVSARLYQGYNKGPTRWAHAHTILLPNGKRVLLTMASDGRFKAMGDCRDQEPEIFQEELLAA
ncbi:hypothetical protein O9X99_01910 [Agrobacterium salinitolerans]|uniref:Uncharacterized protein n=1 Tax=Agrobacterium salinitolerans TaxID=1183413 RepID=A0ABY3BV94_9HYPH|nr:MULTISPECIES: hypothetical protein [Agrobacterium]MCZ7890422.1 hypothetical protein [Agrobacterium salinitolerans]TRA96856.1 hypothetical protein EXN23_01045 [Agrobacterium salinitolerans]